MSLIKTSSESLGTLEQRLKELKKEVHRLKSGQLQHLRDKVTHAAHKAGDYTRTGMKSTRKHISGHPLTCTSSSFGAGAVIGTVVTWLLLRDGR